MTVNTELYDKAVNHAAELRIEEEKLQTTLQRATRDHQNRIGKLVGQNASKSKLLEEVSRYKAHSKNILTNGLEELAHKDLSFQNKNFKGAVGRFYEVKSVSTTSFFGLVKNKNLQGNKNLNEQIDNIVKQQETRINDVLSKQDVPRSQTSSQLKGTSNLTNAQMQTLLATSSTQTQAESFKKTLDKNNDVVKGYRFTAVLDSRTSDICQHHDGEIYDINDTRFTPPLHWNCRSVLVPVIKSHSELQQVESARLNKDILNNMVVSSIARLDGINPRVEDYDTWLRRQPSNVQLKHLNNDEERLQMFQQGNLKLKSFNSARGKPESVAALQRKNFDGSYDLPIKQSKYQPAKNHDYKVNAYRVNDLIENKQSQKQLRELFEIDERYSVSPLATTDYRGVTSEAKRNNRWKSKSLASEDLIFDPVTGVSRNPLIYQPNNKLLQERLDLVNNSKILNKEQKKFINDFQESMTDRVSTNNRSVIVENLRVTFERQLKVDSPSYNRPWENLTAVIRAENVNAVQNVSRRLERLHRKDISKMVKANVDVDARAEPSVNIFGKTRTFTQISNDVNKNQRYSDNWEDTVGLKIATRAYTHGNFPLRNYFLPPSQTNPLDFKKKIIAGLDEAVDTFNFPARIRKAYKQTVADWVQNPFTVAENTLIDFARNIQTKWHDLVDLEFLYRAFNINTRKAIVNNAPEAVKQNTKSLSKALRALSEGATTDYDTLAINMGRAIYETSKIDLPWRKPTLQDYHKSGSRILKDLENQGLIKIGQAVKTRQAAIDVKTNRPDPSGYKEVQQREIEILDPDLAELQRINRELYIGRRIGITASKNKLYLDPPKEGSGGRNLRYKDASGRVTQEKAITRSASSKLGQDEDALGNQLDRDFQKQTNYANSLEWGLDNEFTDFFDDLVYYTPKDATRMSKQPNLFRAVVKQRGEQGTMFMQSMRWHRQNGTSWSNIHQFDGRGRFYEQGYLAATRGELVRPFLNTTFDQKGSPGVIRELKKQLGATVGDGDLALSTAGRFQNFNDNLNDILDLGLIQQGKFNQRQRNLNAFLENKLITHVDDIGDAAEIGKIARYSLEIKRIEDHLNARGLTLRSSKVEKGRVYQSFDENNSVHRKAISSYRTRLLVENDASASGAQQIALATNDRLLADASNVTPTKVKQRLYDIAAKRTVANEEFQKIYGPEGLNLGLDWKDLQKAAKNQNMVTFYGAGDATKTMRLEDKLAKVLTKNEQTIVVYADKAPNLPNAFSQKELLNTIEARINDAEAAGLTNTINALKQTRDELNLVLKKELPISDKLMRYAHESDDIVAEFVRKATNSRAKLLTSKDFETINRIMSAELEVIAPSTEKFIKFTKEAAKGYVNVSGSVDLPWVNYRGKEFTQFYRPTSEDSISFKDPITGKTISNVYRNSMDDGVLRSAGSAGDAMTGYGVNGNHTNDGSLVQGYWLKARDQKKRVATIHDGFFSPIEDADWTVDTLYDLMGQAAESGTLKKTLTAARDKALANINRETRREQSKLIDKLLDKADKGTLTKDDVVISFKTLPGLKERIKEKTKLNDRQINAKLSTVHRRSVLSDLESNINDGFNSTRVFKSSLEEVNLLNKSLKSEFNMTENQLINNFAKHGQKRRLLNTQAKYEANELSEDLFFSQYFKEPSLTPQEAGRYRDAVTKAKKNKQAIPYPSEVLGKKPSSAELLRKQYNVENTSQLVRKIEKGDFDFDEFFKTQLTKTEGALDLNTLKDVLRKVSASNDPDINIDDIVSGIKNYQGNLFFEQIKQRKAINKWYEETVERARELQLIDKNKTNKVIISKLDTYKNERLTKADLPAVYRDFKDDLKQYREINSLAELNRAYSSREFDFDSFLFEQNNRYRELTKADIVRPPAEGEDRYGIGP